jgi:predicted tellurium resistance membrane protein TerC
LLHGIQGVLKNLGIQTNLFSVFTQPCTSPWQPGYNRCKARIIYYKPDFFLVHFRKRRYYGVSLSRVIIMSELIALLFLLIGLELVLGVDNILVITIFVGRLPESQRNKARILGLAVALLARILLLFILLTLSNLTNTIILNFSMRDIILLLGGLFLLWKAVREIHHTIELMDNQPAPDSTGYKNLAGVISQIILLDIVFSIDSVITAIGLTDEIWIIITAVVASFLAILAFAKPIGDFILRRPSLKILALSFLITIGITLFLEGMHQRVPKAYIYLPMGFALFVEILQLRYASNKKKRAKPECSE